MNSEILIIDDDPEAAGMMQATLAGEGYDAEIATDGEEGLKKINQKSYKLILLDIMLPRADGFEICRRLKANPRTKEIPVLVVTALDIPGIIRKCLAAGANDTLLKPFDVEGLMAKIKKLYPRKSNSPA